MADYNEMVTDGFEADTRTGNPLSESKKVEGPMVKLCLKCEEIRMKG